MAGAIILVAFWRPDGTRGNQQSEHEHCPAVRRRLCTGSALAETGAADLLGEGIASLLSGVTNGYIIGFAFYVVGFLMTSLLYNRAVSTVLVPIAVITCNSIGCDPRGPIILCALATMSSLVTPMATAVVPMAMSAGGYSARPCSRPALSLVLFAASWVL